MDRLHSTGGFWLLTGALLLAAPLSLVGWFLLACAAHELGHILAIRALGGRVDALHLTGLGAVLIPGWDRVTSYGEECWIALAGPGASLLLALLAAPWSPTLAGVSLALGLFNLLPLSPLDGGRVLRAVVSRWIGPDAGERVCRLVTRVLAAVLAVLSLGAGNVILLVVCLGLALSREKASPV